MNSRKDNLNENDVWIFTKQATSFNEAFRAVQLFERAIELEENIESYFLNHFAEFGLSTDRHRILAISQFFGLLTKTPYNTKRNYKYEKPTEVFYLLKKYNVDSFEFNTIKTEQMLKIKIRAIIDNEGNNLSWNILPVIYTYQVLKKLKLNHRIDSISEDDFYTYVMTSRYFSYLDETVDLIYRREPVTKHLDSFKSRSRIEPILKQNTKLFVFDVQRKISINTYYEDYFDRFLANINISSLETTIDVDIDYAFFLNNHQNFNVNLIDNILSSQPIIIEESSINYLDEEKDNYSEIVNQIDSKTLNLDIAIDGYKIEPKFVISSKSEKFRKRPMIGKVAIVKNNYKCNIDEGHTTFIAKTTLEQYMEPHHLIPVSYGKKIWQDLGINIDCLENIITLCPNCHRAIHLSDDSKKTRMLFKMYSMRSNELRKIGINYTFDDLKKIYNLD